MLLVFASFNAFAQDAKPLELAEAQAIAARNNPATGIAAARLTQARAIRRQAFSGLFPSLIASGTYTRRTEEQVREFPGQEPVVVQKKDAFAGQLALEMSLLDARIFAGLSVAAHALEAQELESNEIQRTLAFDVAESFFAILSAESLYQASAKRLEAAKVTAAEARSRFEAGLAAKNEATRTGLELATADLAHTQARTVMQRARLALAHLMNESIAGRPLIEPALVPLPELETKSLEETARAERADVLALFERAEQADALAREPLMRLIPTLGLRGLVFASNETGLGNKTADANLSAILTWTIFDGGERYADRDLRLAQAEETRLRAEELQRSAALDVRSAMLDVENARASLGQAEVQATVAAENATEVRILFASGLASALQQVDAAVEEFEANAAFARQKVAARVAELALLRALGRWPNGGGRGDSE